MRQKHWSSGLFALAAVAAASATSYATVHIVQQSGLSFSPSSITVSPGDTVRWTWSGGSHTATSGANCTADGMFDFPLDSTHPTADWIVPANAPSTVPYFCIPHCVFDMVGVINVVVPGTPVAYQSTLDAAQEGGSVTSIGKGTGTFTFTPGTNVLEWNVAYQDLSGPATAAHIHGPARPCNNAPPIITFATTNPIVGSAVLTAPQVAALEAGLLYVNIHTAANPGGEIRGQIAPTPFNGPLADIPQGDVTVRLKPIATGLVAPNSGEAAPGDSQNIYVTDQPGTLWKINTTTGAKSVFLDVSARLVPLGVGGPGTFDERGLLGVAFHPDYATNGKLYTFTSEPVAGPADYSTIPVGQVANCQSVIAEWVVPNPSDPNSVVDPGSRRELLRIDKPQFNHNGGDLEFGPDGMLYISTGDGGGADDQDGLTGSGAVRFGHGCSGNAQNTGNPLGKILRIDPDGSNSPNGKYGIPASNPFVGGGGLGEIFAYGLRNPFRFSFDRTTGDLWAGDVGQNQVEEVNMIVSGGNYGWRWKEGSFWFLVNGNASGYVTDQPLDVPAGLIDPVAQYDHGDGISALGGYVYRGSKLPMLSGTYVFGDFARTFSNDGRLFYLDDMDMIMEFGLPGGAQVGHSVLGFGEDTAGELYVMVNSTGVPSGTTGEVWRIAPTACIGDMNCDGKVDFSDINKFVEALSGQAAWEANAANAGCPWLNADANNDGSVTFKDIDPFVGTLGDICD